MKKLLFLVLISCTTVFAQRSINTYKYVIVPKKQDGFKKVDQYQTSSLLKFLFNKYGFIAFFDQEEGPNDLKLDDCNVLTAAIRDKSGFLSTKVEIALLDCRNREVYVAKQGFSKIKDYKKAFHEALRESFNSIRRLNYKYVSKANETVTTASTMKVSTERKQNFSKVTNTKKEKLDKTIPNPNIKIEALLYAQPKSYGYQLINDEPKVVFKLLKTKDNSRYIIKDKNGTFTQKENGVWLAEFYEEDKLVSKFYKVKF